MRYRDDPEPDPDEAYERQKDREIELLEQAHADDLAGAMAAEERLGLIPDDDYWEEAHAHEWEGR